MAMPALLRLFRWSVAALSLAAAGCLVWMAAVNSHIAFLTPGPGQWIAYPVRRDVRVVWDMPLPAVFRRTFVLDRKPAAANLSWRSFRAGEIRVNGAVVSKSPASGGNWKNIVRLDITAHLRAGTNVVEAAVVAAPGPPALSLKIAADHFYLESDERWDVSEAGSVWLPARPAWKIPPAAPGNAIRGVETTAEAFRRRWPLLLIFAAGSLLAAWGISKWDNKIQMPFLAVIGVAWAALFVHNSSLLPLAMGFDGADHLTYIRYLQEHRAMPSPNQGFEMFQPPLYYASGALLLGLLHLNTLEMSGMVALRLFSLAAGAAILALIFASLRLIFPGEWKKQTAGVVLAAFLPMFVCLLHYPTNETLSAMLVTAALYLCLRMLRAPEISPRPCAALGAVLGLAMLAKASAILALPPIFGVLAARLAGRRQRAPAIWLTTLGLTLEICLALCGWHYWNIWRHFGNPFAGNWDPSIAVPWWQLPGCHSWNDYLSFGSALTHPFFSSFNGVWDSLYSTLWGDGLCAGTVSLFQRPPWNYNVMAMGFALALAPAILVLTGFVRAAFRCWREPSLDWLLLTGLAALCAFSIIYMTLKLPFFSQAKSFYGLPALLPFCCFGALGLEFWAGAGRARRIILLTILGTWMTTVYASFWIRPRAVRAELSSAVASLYYGNESDPAQGFLKVLEMDPANSVATAFLAELDSRRGDNDRAARRVERALRQKPGDAYLEARGAPYLAAAGHLPEAMTWASNATFQAPDDFVAPEVWCALALKANQYGTAEHAARIALGADPFFPSTRVNLGIALLNLGKTNEAVEQFSLATKGFSPPPPAH